MQPADFDTRPAAVQPSAMDRRPLPPDSEEPIRSAAVPGGFIPGTAGQPAFSIVAAEPSVVPIVIAVPHGGRAYPDGLLATMRDPTASALRLEDRLVDRVGEALAQATGAPLILAHAPRAMIDLNRATDDMDWSMVAGGGRPLAPAGGEGSLRGRARSGLGLVPRRLPGSGEIWKAALDPADLAARIENIHTTYHQALEQLLARVRARWGAVLLIDLHSMPPVTLGAGASPPEFVIGDRFGAACSGALVAAAFGWFGRAGRVAAHNRPYAGGYGLDRHAAPRRQVHALQIEVDRRSYLDSGLVELGAGFDRTVDLLAGLVAELAARVAELGGEAPHYGWREAAE